MRATSSLGDAEPRVYRRLLDRAPAILGLALLAATPPSVQSQQDTSSLHATILGWSDRTWLYLLDRGAVDGGGLNDQGMLMRFHPDIDDEYAIDAISVRPGLGDEYVWEYGENGARYRGGSINHRMLAAGMDIKAGVGLGRGWRVGFRFDKDGRPGLDRNVPRFGVEKLWRKGMFAFGEGTLFADKPEMDVAVGGGWRDAAGEARVSFTVTDAPRRSVGSEYYPPVAGHRYDA